MMEEKCTYRDKNKSCDCILHCKKDDWYVVEDGTKKWDETKVNLFWNTIQSRLMYRAIHEEKIEENNSNAVREYSEYIDPEEILNYKGVIFPCFQEESLENLDINFYAKSNYLSLEDYQVKIFQEKNIEFNDCHFLGITDFKKYTFMKSLRFFNCEFYSNDVDLSNKIFNKTFLFKECKNIGKLNLHRTIINGSASFKGSNFKEVDFRHVKFKKLVVLSNTTFENDVNLEYTDFGDNLYFVDVIINGKLNLRDTIFQEEANFLDIKNESGKKLEAENIANRETARIIKHSFDKIGNIIEANKFYALEMEKREEELNDKSHQDNNLLEWLVFKFHKISSNHSQDWFLVLKWIINIGFIASFFSFYSITDRSGTYIHLTSQSLYIVILFIFFISLVKLVTHKNILVFFNVLPYILYVTYALSTHDIFLTYYAQNLNPFSVMQGNDSITIGELFFKIILGYLYYQFIVSVRQNTRRK